MPQTSATGSPRRAAQGRSPLRRLADWRLGAAALAVGTLGAAVAAAGAGTGVAQSIGSTSPAVVTIIAPGVAQPSAFQREPERTTRSTKRVALPAATVAARAEERAERLADNEQETRTTAHAKAVQRRAATLRKTQKSTAKEARVLAALKGSGASGTMTRALAGLDTGGRSCLPLGKGYSIAARFGDTGSWSRYHTGIDFADGIGTPILAPAAGIVTNAGLGKASAWAGNYVTIQYPNGMSTLMAHMSAVNVKVGDVVKPCQRVGAIGMTGRSFGPHLHFELYPAAVTPGDLYQAIDPAPWLRAQHLRP